MTTKHSPTPWSIAPTPETGSAWTITSESGFICNGWGPGSKVDDANAALIVRAVNSHQALIDALCETVAQISYLRGVMTELQRQATGPTTREALDQARAALALAQEGAR